MAHFIKKLFEDLGRHLLVYIFLILAIIFGLLLRRNIVGLSLFTLAIGILIGQETPKD